MLTHRLSVTFKLQINVSSYSTCINMMFVHDCLQWVHPSLTRDRHPTLCISLAAALLGFNPAHSVTTAKQDQIAKTKSEEDYLYIQLFFSFFPVLSASLINDDGNKEGHIERESEFFPLLFPLSVVIAVITDPAGRGPARIQWKWWPCYS